MQGRPRLVRISFHLSQDTYDRLVERAGLRAIAILRDQGKGNRAVLNRLRTSDNIAFREAYEQIFAEAITDWLDKQENNGNHQEKLQGDNVQTHHISENGRS